MGLCCSMDPTLDEDIVGKVPKQQNKRIYEHTPDKKFGYSESVNINQKEINDVFFAGEFEDQSSFFEWKIIAPDNTVKTAKLWFMFDGHNSWEVATYCAGSFPEFFAAYVRDLSDLELIPSTIEMIFERFDKKILQMGYSGGCTCAGVLMVGELLWMIHLGDCKVLLFQKGEIIHETENHTRQAGQFRELQKTHGCTDSGGGLSTTLSLSRVLGDWGLTSDKHTSLKHLFSCVPHVTRIDLADFRREAPLYIMLTTHGLLEAMNPTEIARSVTPHTELNQVCRDIIHTARDKRAKEDISLFLINAWIYLEEDPFSTFARF